MTDTYLITLTTADKQTLQFDCQINEDVVSAAERQQIILPQQCRSGACSFCTATTVAGAYQLRDYNIAALSDNQRAEQQTLLCRTYPQSALTIHTPYPYAEIRFGQIPQAEHRIIEKTALTADVVHLVLEQCADMDNLLSANIVAGQYMQLMPPDRALKRTYSLANPANWEGKLEFFIQLWENGQFSQFLQQTQIGDAVVARGSQGDFVLNVNSLKPRWFIAGGTGLAPLLAMLRQMAEFGEIQPARLFFGTRYPTDVFAQAQLADLKSQLPQFDYQICLSKPDTDWMGYHGSVVTAVAEALHTISTQPDIYLCGSDRLVDGILAVLDKVGLSEENVFYERFSG